MSGHPRRQLRIVETRFVASPDAGARLKRVYEILLAPQATNVLDPEKGADCISPTDTTESPQSGGAE